MSKKDNNRHVYPNANHQPRQLANLRKQDALARQAEYDKLSLEEKIAKLPPEPYSKKQRARLLSALKEQNTLKPEATVEVAQESFSKEDKKMVKRYMRDQK